MVQLGVAAVCALGLGVVGCGARTALDVSTDAAPARDAPAPPRDAGPPRPPPPPATCLPNPPPRWESCVPLPSAIDLSPDRHGQGPDVVWAGDRLVVVYESGGSHVDSFAPDGTRLSTRTIGSLQQSLRVAWNEELDVGLVGSSIGFTWLDGEGVPLSDGFIADTAGRPAMAPDVMAHERGFRIVTDGTPGGAERGLYAATVGPEPERPSWVSLVPGGPWSAPEHAVLPGAGHARWLVATDFDGATAVLLDATRLTVEGTFDRVEGSAFDGSVCGLAALAEYPVHALLCGRASAALFSVRLERMARFAGSADYGPSPFGSDGALEAAVGTLVLATSHGDPEDRITLHALDAEALPAGAPIVVAGGPSHSPRLARTPCGLAVVWSERGAEVLGTRLQILHCTPRAGD